MRRRIPASSRWRRRGPAARRIWPASCSDKWPKSTWRMCPIAARHPALNDLIPGRVDSYFGSASLLENMRSGQIRGLGVTGLKRDPVAPELPTIAEAGVPGYEVSSWQGLFVPARTPPEIVKKMSVDTIEALADPAARRKLEQAGYPVAGSSPGELQALLRSDIDKWSHVIKTVGIKID